MKELLSNLYGVIVPDSSYDFEIMANGIGFMKSICRGVTVDFIDLNFQNRKDLKILGTASEKEITFDVESLVIRQSWESLSCFGGYYTKVSYLDYKTQTFRYSNEENSFKSLIKSKGIELKPNEKLLVLIKQ